MGNKHLGKLGRELAVGENANAFALLQQIIAKPNFDFQSIINKELLILISLISIWSNQTVGSMVGSCSALYDLHQGNPNHACANVRAMLALVKANADERLTNFRNLFALPLLRIARVANWEILQ